MYYLSRKTIWYKILKTVTSPILTFPPDTTLSSNLSVALQEQTSLLVVRREVGHSRQEGLTARASSVSAAISVPPPPPPRRGIVSDLFPCCRPKPSKRKIPVFRPLILWFNLLKGGSLLVIITRNY